MDLWKGPDPGYGCVHIVDRKLAAREEARLLLSRSCRSTTLSTVDEVAVNPVSVPRLAPKHNLLEIAEACRRGLDGFTGNEVSWWILPLESFT